MTRDFNKRSRNELSFKGFTLIELLVTIAILGIMLAIATPSFVQWRNNANFRQTARQITSMLREARSYTIANNVTHSVLVKPSNNSYTLLRNTTVLQQSFTRPPVLIRDGGGGMTNISVVFSSNGTASLTPADGKISIQDGTNPKFLVTVTPTGRISLQQKY